MAAFSNVGRGLPQLFLLPILLLLGVFLSSTRLTLEPESKWGQAFSFAAVTVLVVASSVQLPNPVYPGLWAGFGTYPTAVALGLAVTIVFGPFTARSIDNRLRTRLGFYYFLPIFLVLPLLTLFVQPQNGLINLGDTTYHVLDELLAPLNGAVPYGDFTPQYTGTLGFLLTPLRMFPMSGELTMSFVILFCNLLNLAIPLLIVAISRTLFPRFRRVVLFSAFVAIWTVCGSELGYSTQIREFSVLARYAAPLFSFWLLLRAVSSMEAQRSRLGALLAGVSIGFAILNSADTGIPLALATIISLALLRVKRRISTGFLFRVVSGMAVLVGGYVLAIAIAGYGPSLRSYLGIRSDGLRGELYGGGQQLAPIGPQLLLLLTPVILIAIAGQSLRQVRLSKSHNPMIEVAASVLGLWTLLLLVRFLLKTPSTAVEVPEYSAPAFLTAVILLGLTDLSEVRLHSYQHRIGVLSALFLVALPVAVIYPDSNVAVRDELKRISGRYLNTSGWSSSPSRSSDGWSTEGLKTEDDLVNRISGMSTAFWAKDVSVGYFGPYGHTVELLTKVENLVGISSTESLRFGTSQKQLACVPVNQSKKDVIIVYSTDFPCRGYVFAPQESTPKFGVWMRDR